VCLTSQRRPDATPRNDESLPPDESGRLVRRVERALYRRAGVEESERLGPTGRLVLYTCNVTRASEVTTSRTNSDASWTWLIYASEIANLFRTPAEISLGASRRRPFALVTDVTGRHSFSIF
jgi:hypothetical protein